MKTIGVYLFILALSTGCQSRRGADEVRRELQAINVSQGEIALCGTGQFGRVEFGLSCEEKVQADFNLATALLHSFEYAEAEKVFARVVEADPACIMAYWGIAMSNFHPLWAPPSPEELDKGSKTIALVRSQGTGSGKEAEYIEAIATIFDGWEKLDHNARLEKFVKATEAIHVRYPGDKEAAIFYALALRASADPADKSFAKQKKAGAVLSSLFPDQPDHPGIAHYLIHTYDYPELAGLALPAARKYAAIAANSAHAQHMPSHIFTRLGLWDEAIQSNIRSTEAAKCYAENLGKAGHWDQELHGLDYLVYAYLQEGKDDLAKEQVEYLATIDTVFPITFVNAYTFAATPVRYALERKDWKQAANLELHPATFPWNKFLWQKAIHHFGVLLGSAHIHDVAKANAQLEELKEIQSALVAAKKDYEANQVMIQVKSAEAWLYFFDGRKKEALQLMTEAAAMEDATEKHSVTPGEVAPARELLGDMYLELGDHAKAAEAYAADLKNRPGRFNSVYGAALAARKAGDRVHAKAYFEQLLKLAPEGSKTRPEIKEAESFLKGV